MIGEDVNVFSTSCVKLLMLLGAFCKVKVTLDRLVLDISISYGSLDQALKEEAIS